MTDKTKKFAFPATKTSTKRPSSVSVASSSRQKPPAVCKENPLRSKSQNTRPKSRNTSIVDSDSTISMPEYDQEYRQIAYGNFLRAMLEECVLDEKIEREENQIDVQMAQLAERFQKTVNVLDQTNRRLKEVSFVVEHKRLLDMKQRECSNFYEATDTSNAQDILQHISNTEQACLDKLETKNIDFGYNKDSGHKQLLDAVNDAIDGLEQIKKHSNLDMHKFKEYEKSQKSLDEFDRNRMDLESLGMDFDEKYPKLSESLLKEASEKIAKMIENDE